jgi:hypothetical protein
MTKQQYTHDSTQSNIDKLSAFWAKRISDPPCEARIFHNLLVQFGMTAVLYAVGATVRRFEKGGIDYNGCLRYCVSVARRKHEDATAFHAPAAWLRNSE